LPPLVTNRLRLATSGRLVIPPPSSEGLGFGFVANHFDVDESCIVVRVIVRAQTRRTIVFATRLQSRAIESFDLLAIFGDERK